MNGAIDDVVGFQWDNGNVDKNLIAHAVENWECEQVFFNEPLLVLNGPRHSAMKKRWATFGSTNGGRPLVVIFTRRANMIRIISARNMNRKEKIFYEETR